MGKDVAWSTYVHQCPFRKVLLDIDSMLYATKHSPPTQLSTKTCTQTHIYYCNYLHFKSLLRASPLENHLQLNYRHYQGLRWNYSTSTLISCYWQLCHLSGFAALQWILPILGSRSPTEASLQMSSFSM